MPASASGSLPIGASLAGAPRNVAGGTGTSRASGSPRGKRIVPGVTMFQLSAKGHRSRFQHPVGAPAHIGDAQRLEREGGERTRVLRIDCDVSCRVRPLVGRTLDADVRGAHRSAILSKAQAQARTAVAPGTGSTTH